MRLTTITTQDQRRAVLFAGQAARLIVDRIEEAALIELSAVQEPDPVGPGQVITTAKYALFSVWPAAEGEEPLWADDPQRGPVHRLTDQDVREVERLLTLAGETDPNIFMPDELANGVWQLLLPAVLAADESEAATRIVHHIRLDVEMSDLDLDDLVNETGAEHGACEDQVQKVIGGSVHDKALFLLRHLGEREAWSAVEIHRAAA